MLEYDIIKIETHPNLTLEVWFRDGLNGKIELLPQYLTGVLQPLTQQEIFKRAIIEDCVVRWPDELDISAKSMYHAIEHQQRVGCIAFII